MNLKQILSIEHHFRQIMLAMEIDLTDPNYIDTPRRFAKVYDEIFAGLDENAGEKLEKILSTTFPAKYNQMIITKNLKVWSCCPHHFLPVEMTINFAYIPSNSVIGLSKVPRAIQLLAAKPILQEQLTTDIVSVFEKCLQPKGCVVHITGEHLCMKMRGVKTHSAEVTTTSFTGCFELQTSRSEFFDSIK